MHTFFYSRHRALLIIAFILLMAGSHSAMAFPSNSVVITESRNAAAGFAITLWMANVDALGTHCSTLEGESDKPFTSALESWKRRNSPYVDAALKYMGEIEDHMAANQGEEARKKFRDDRKADFTQATHTTEAVSFRDGKIDSESCLNMANHAADGSMDLDKNKEFFPMLQEIKTDMDGSSR